MERTLLTRRTQARRIALLAGICALAAAAPARAAQWRPDVAAARAYLHARPGIAAFAVRTPTRFYGYRADRVFPSASVLKAMLLAAYLRHARDRPLRADERALLSPMIRRSDNDAATAIRNRLGDAALVRLAHAAGMTRFRPAAIWGLSQITARDQTRFFLRIDALLPPRHRAYGMTLLRTVVPSQRWGIGRLKLPGWKVYFKGGWGSATGRVDHQVALLTHGGIRLSVAVLTLDDGTHAAGKATLEGTFRRLLRGLLTVGH
jgi:beta-lactamase class A